MLFLISARDIGDLKFRTWYSLLMVMNLKVDVQYRFWTSKVKSKK